jgi:uncharacterized protein (TIGR02996 family)
VTATGDGMLLLKAILAKPGEDTPRLVFADWLEENGEEAQAEFIRVQCRLATEYPEEVAGRSDYLLRSAGGIYYNLRAREQKLLPHWVKSLPGAYWIKGHTFGFSFGDNNQRQWFTAVACRGFVPAVFCNAAYWFQHQLTIIAAQPIERVKLTSPTGIDYFDSDMQLLWIPGLDNSPVVDQDDLLPTRKEGDSDEVAFLRYLSPGIEFTLVPVAD